MTESSGISTTLVHMKCFGRDTLKIPCQEAAKNRNSRIREIDNCLVAILKMLSNNFKLQQCKFRKQKGL